MEDILHGKISKQRLGRWLDEVNKKLEGDKQLKEQMREEMITNESIPIHNK